MKRSLSLFLLSMLSCLTMLAQEIWSGTQTINWNGNNEFVQIESSKLADLAVADRLEFDITYTGGVNYPQIGLLNGSWNQLNGSGNTSLSEGMKTVSYYVSSLMLPELKNKGMVVTGHGYTLNKITVVKNESDDDYSQAVWIGNTVIPMNWGVSVQLPPSCFKSAQVGHLLRLRHKDIQSGAQMSPRNSSWNTLADGAAKTAAGIYTEYTITEAMLAELQAGGMIVAGCGFTLTSVDVIDPANIVNLNCEVPVQNNWVWTNGQQPSLYISIGNPTTADYTTTAELQVMTDKLQEYATSKKSITIAGGKTAKAEFAFDAEPGFYQVTAIVDGQLVKTFNIGVDPEQIVSAPDMQSDFDNFWQAAKDELAKVTPDYKLTELTDKSSAKRKVYLVEMNSINDNDGHPGIVRAYYAEPTDGKKHAAIIHYQGYDSGGYDPWIMSGDDQPDYAELIVATRGQLINNRAPYENTYGDWVVYGLGSESTYYYRQAYMDCLRAIDFMESREAVDANNIFAEGQSQGGAFTLAAAALSGKFRAIAPAIPFMGDFPDYMQVASWPSYPLNQKAQELGISNDELLRELSYFDTKNLATLIQCPVIMTMGLQDNVCPPHTNIAPYNNLPGSVEKQYSINAELLHQTHSTWWNEFMAFFTNHLDGSTTGIDTIPTEESDDTLYNIAGQKVGRDYKGIVITNGKKLLKK